VAAYNLAATAFAVWKSGRGTGKRWRHGRARALPRLIFPSFLMLSLGLATSAHAASNKVRVTNLNDVAFGSLANLSFDAVRSQSVCLYSDTNTSGYTIAATGTGPAGTFELASGSAALPYEVRWSSTSGQTTGVQLTPNVPLTGQTSAAIHQTCNTGPATSASLVLVLRSSALSSASAGTYSGTLTLIVGPE
jgi:hypothetical protein